MKRIVREFEFSPQQQKEVASLARELGVLPMTAGILYARGMDTQEKMRDFLTPSSRHFLPPELMSGMTEAKELLLQAREEGWNVAVFGDYDADGIGASSILYRALVAFGIEPYLYVPERSEGYGMSVSAIDKIFDEFMPDLIVTVDCGISNAKEVEYIKEQGAFVIVTDHHELPEKLPNCICINPKIEDDYPYDNLCGAGVAFKLACALLGSEAYELLDICALSTVADSVPLLGENRDIVCEGLKRINETPRSAFSAVLGKTSDEVTAQTLAFTVAPRVNAAGRMGDARAALRLFTSDDEEEIALLAEKLNLYNSERQKLCDELYECARAEIVRRGAYGNIVMAMGEGWHAGLVGIVAARIAEEFSRPALLFVKNGDMLRGSARSIENINVYEALRACSEYLTEFGGHSQAAGVNLRVENFQALQDALDKYLEERYTEEDFIPTLYSCGEVAPREVNTLAHELNKLEPFGVGNRRPLFSVTAGAMKATPIRADSPHLTISCNGADYMYFGGAKYLKTLKSGMQKTLVYDYNVSRFRGREYVKGFVRSVVYDGATKEISGYALENALSLMTFPQTAQTTLTEREINDYILQKREESRYGLCVVAYRVETLKSFPAVEGLPVEVFSPTSSGAQNTVLLAPDSACDLSAYRDIVFLEKTESLPIQTGKATVFFNGERGVLSRAGALFLEREEMLAIYASLKNAVQIEGDGCAEAGKQCSYLGFDAKSFIFALAVFTELGLVEHRDGKYTVVRGKKSDLNNSAIYAGLQKIAKEEA